MNLMFVKIEIWYKLGNLMMIIGHLNHQNLIPKSYVAVGGQNRSHLNLVLVHKDQIVSKEQDLESELESNLVLMVEWDLELELESNLVVVVVEVIKILTHQLPHHIQEVGEEVKVLFVGGCYS